MPAFWKFAAASTAQQKNEDKHSKETALAEDGTALN